MEMVMERFERALGECNFAMLCCASGTAMIVTGLVVLILH
jgi:hypothetical protein